MCLSNSLSQFRNGLAGIIRPDNIVEDAAILDGYSRDISLVTGSRPLLAVYPESRDEVQEIVRLASQSRMPLVPVSSGPPRFHGDTLPNQNSVIVDFSRMKRILKIDPVSRFAMIEPGVTYGELTPELHKQGLKLSMPLLPCASKSVVTSRLEREPTLIPKYQYDYIDPLLTLEVVYGTGDDFRTGSASGPGTPETLKADMVNPWGPGVIDFFRFVSGAQGTMGLVTWAITKVEVLPTLQKLYFIAADDEKAATVLMNRLLRRRVGDECLALNNVNLATILAETWPDDYKELKRSLPRWTVMVCLAGYQRRSEERVTLQEKYLKDICKDLGLVPETTLPGAQGRESDILKMLNSPYGKEPYWKLRHKDACHDIFFLTTLSQVPKFVNLMKEVAARNSYPNDDIGTYIQPMVQGRGCHIEFSIPSDTAKHTEVAPVRNLFRDTSQTLMENGAFFSRPYGQWADMVYQEETEEVKALRKLKTIFDPNNILNPGKLCFPEGEWTR